MIDFDPALADATGLQPHFEFEFHRFPAFLSAYKTTQRRFVYATTDTILRATKNTLYL